MTRDIPLFKEAQEAQEVIFILFLLLAKCE